MDLLAARRIVDNAEEQRLRRLLADATSLADMPAMAEPDPAKRQQTARKLAPEVEGPVAAGTGTE